MTGDVAILSLGLMGGSLGLALKRAEPGVRVHGFTRSRERGELALARQAIDQLHDDPREAVRHADVVVCCAPILAIPPQLAMVAEALKPGAVVTDVGSTKAMLQQECSRILRGRDAFFVGSHPIAGSEQQGMEAAREDLYRHAMVVVTPGADTKPEHAAAIRSLWLSCGACVAEMSPEEHDATLAATSHLPHVVASLLAATIGRSGQRPDLARFCGTGYRDTTRVAAGGTDIWMDIVKTNRAPLTGELKAFALKLNLMIEKLEQSGFSDIEGLLEKGKQARQTCIDYGHQSNSEE